MNRLVRITAVAAIAAALPVSARAAARGAAQESNLTLRVPVGASLRSLELYLDVPGSFAREEQVAQESDSLLSIGRVRQAVVDVKSGKVEKRKAAIEQPVLFYLYSPTSHLQDFEIGVVSARTADGFVTEGATPPKFVVEVLQLRALGDTRGKVLKRFDDVSFKVGDLNRFPVGMDVPAGSTLGVRIWAERGGAEEIAIQIKASKKGKYPAHLLRKTSEGEVEAGEGCYNPDVAFSYRGAPAGGKFVSGNPLERLAEQINNYVRGQAADGKASGEVTVPLKVRLELEQP